MATESVATPRPALRDWLQLTRLHRPIGIFLLLWPTLWSLWIASEGHPDWHVFAVMVLGVVLMRSAGCVINDYADRDFDPHVARTVDRPIAAGRISPKQALLFFAALCLIAFGLVLTLNLLTIGLSFAGLLLAVIYPFMKRYTYLPQVFLGAAFGWAIPMAYAAQTGTVPNVAWLLFIGNVLWSTAYDTMYAMTDREDDLRVGVKSTAILFGDADRTIIGIIQALVLIDLAVVGHQAGLWGGYFVGLLLAAGLMAYQQYLIRDRVPEACFQAFLNNNWFGAVVFFAIALGYI
ncbi:MAG: 4-hydroxybenzoate octaprenyltransferase [Gammaproteobacteria bacterium]|nr:4-hydroxybenzoate octaprenyltransferase [Gammaproteobacteria bacterium]